MENSENVWAVHPDSVEPIVAENEHIKGQVIVRVLSRNQTVLENTFPPNTWLGKH